MIVVTGATGSVGRHVARGLHERGHDVVAVSRDPDRAAGLLPSDVRRATVDDVDWSAAGGLFVNQAAFPDGVGDLLDAAVTRGGVERVVALSTYTVLDDDPRNAIATRHRAMESCVRAAGVDWVLPRPAGGFASTALEWSREIRATRTVQAPYGDAEGAPIHEQDIADVCVAGFEDDALVGTAPMFSGPASLSYRDRARTIGEVLGEPVEFIELDDDAARERMTAVGVPPHAVEARLRMFAALVGVEHEVHDSAPFTGHAPRTFRDWVEDHRDAFA